VSAVSTLTGGDHTTPSTERDTTMLAALSGRTAHHVAYQSPVESRARRTLPTHCPVNTGWGSTGCVAATSLPSESNASPPLVASSAGIGSGSCQTMGGGSQATSNASAAGKILIGSEHSSTPGVHEAAGRVDYL
jgi:hypothetical protein